MPEGGQHAAIPHVRPCRRPHSEEAGVAERPLNYHDRGDIDFTSCGQACFEQGDFFGLDDLFTEQPAVVQGLADHPRDAGSSASRSTASASTPPGTSTRRSSPSGSLHVPQRPRRRPACRTSSSSARSPTWTRSSVDLRARARAAERPRLPDAGRADTGFAGGDSRRPRRSRTRLDDDDYFRGKNGGGRHAADVPRQPRHGPGGAADPQPGGGRVDLAGELLRRRPARPRPALPRCAGRRSSTTATRSGSWARAATRPRARTCSRRRWRSGGPSSASARRRSAPARRSPSRSTRSRSGRRVLGHLRDTIPALDPGASFVRYTREGARRQPHRRDHKARVPRPHEQRDERRHDHDPDVDAELELERPLRGRLRADHGSEREDDA